jgi:hypothetical protein
VAPGRMGSLGSSSRRSSLTSDHPWLELRHGQLEPAHYRVLAAHHRQAQPVPHHLHTDETVGLAPHVAGARAEYCGQRLQARPETFFPLPAAFRSYLEGPFDVPPE